jgi:hypothetical protein
LVNTVSPLGSTVRLTFLVREMGLATSRANRSAVDASVTSVGGGLSAACPTRARAGPAMRAQRLAVIIIAIQRWRRQALQKFIVVDAT